MDHDIIINARTGRHPGVLAANAGLILMSMGRCLHFMENLILYIWGMMHEPLLENMYTSSQYHKICMSNEGFAICSFQVRTFLTACPTVVRLPILSSGTKDRPLIRGFHSLTQIAIWIGMLLGALAGHKVSSDTQDTKHNPK